MPLHETLYIPLSAVATGVAKRAYSVLPTLYGYIRTSRRLIAGEPGNDPDTQRLHALGIQTFFCDTRSPWQKGGVENAIGRLRHPIHTPVSSPWQKGGVENAIGRLRRPLPRKTRLVDFSEAAFTQIIQLYNNTPRKCLGYRTPAETLDDQVLHLECELTPKWATVELATSRQVFRQGEISASSSSPMPPGLSGIWTCQWTISGPGCRTTQRSATCGAGAAALQRRENRPRG